MSLNQQLYADHVRGRSVWPVVAAIIVVALIGGVAWFFVSGGPGHSRHASGQPLDSAVTSFPSTSANVSPAAARLAATMLRRSDLPGAGWTATPNPPDPNDDSEQAALVACVGRRNTAPDKTGDLESPQYSSGTVEISSNATSYRSQADIATDVAILRDPKFIRCEHRTARADLARTAPAGATIDGVNISFTSHPRGLPHNVVGLLSGRIRVSGAGGSVTAYLTAADIVGPLVEAQVEFIGVAHPVPASISRPLVNKIAARVARARVVAATQSGP